MELFNMSDFAKEMQDVIIDKEAEELNISLDEGFKISSLEQATFFMKRAAEAQNEINSITAYCEEEIRKYTEKVKDFMAEKVKGLENIIQYNSSLLEEYAKGALKDSKKKSISTPFGTMKFTTSKEKYEFDNSKMLSVLEMHELDSLIRKKLEVNKIDFNKAVQTVDGVTTLTVDGKTVDITPLVVRTLPQEVFSIKTK